jgi:hypothetical protein
MEVDSKAFSVTCTDGTVFLLFDEHVRGEPRFYWAQYKRPRDTKFERCGAEGAYNKPVAWTELKRIASEYEGDHPAHLHVSNGYDRRKWRRR